MRESETPVCFRIYCLHFEESHFRRFISSSVIDIALLLVPNSHELRTPMACIIGLLDMLLMENLTVEHEGSVRQIHRCATSLVSLLNSALDIAKVFFFFSFPIPCNLSFYSGFAVLLVFEVSNANYFKLRLKQTMSLFNDGRKFLSAKCILILLLPLRYSSETNKLLNLVKSD